MSENQVETPAKPPAPTPQEMRTMYADFQQQEWNGAANKVRAEMARARGLLANFKQPGPDATEAEKKASQAQYAAILATIVLEGDTMRYAKDKDGRTRMATDRAGFMSLPKQRGRRKPHMTPHAQGLKSAALHIFGGLFRHRMVVLETEAKAAGETFNGVPQAELTKLAAKASVKAAAQVKESRTARRRRMRNESKLQRRINRGAIPGNTNRRAYTIN